MKRFFALALSAVMLCGCDMVVPEETLAPTVAPTEPEPQPPTEPPVIRHEALEVAELPHGNILSAAPMGSDILLLLERGMVKLDGDDLSQAAGSALSPEQILQVSDAGLCCLADGQMVFLNADLKAQDRISLPEGITGTPLVSEDLQTVYYAAGSSIRVMNWATGRDRLLRQTNWQDLTLVKLHEAQALLECRVVDADGREATLFFSAESGTLSQQYGGTVSLSVGGNHTLQFRQGDDGIKGRGIQGQDLFAIGTDQKFVVSILRDGSKPMVLISQGDAGMELEFCSSDGVVTAGATVDAAALGGIWGNEEENCIWLLCDQNRLYRWDLEESAVTDGIVRLHPRYTRDNPDTAGLEALTAQAQTMLEPYPVSLHLAEDAVTVIPEGYTAVSEYRVSKLAEGAETLVQLLEQFPEGFLRQAAQSSSDKKLHIALVQSMAGSIAHDTPVDAVDVQFRDDSGRIFMMITMGDSLSYGFWHSLGHVIDSRILSRCDAFDNWNDLNPGDFDYDYSYNLNAAREDEEVPKAFLNPFSMSFPTEDRAVLFAHAMTGGNEALFQSEAIQKKLNTLCTGIRRAFSLSESDLPWEQYLQ